MLRGDWGYFFFFFIHAVDKLVCIVEETGAILTGMNSTVFVNQFIYDK